MKFILLLYAIIALNSLRSQNPFQQEFNIAYQQFPNVPRGVLEAVSYTQTHFKHLSLFEEPSCAGLPQAQTLMGLIEDGKGYFRNNLNTISQLSGYSKNDILASPQTTLLAYANAYQTMIDSFQLDNNVNNHSLVLAALSELPIDHNPVNNFAINAHLYGIFAFLKDKQRQMQLGFPDHSIDINHIFGEDNAKILGSSKIVLTDSLVSNSSGLVFQSINRSNEYGPAIWTPAPSCNYSSRASTPISAITIHTIQGTYAGAISWSQNCSSNVSYHYVIRSSDGQVTQMVLEANKAWHVGSANPYTIGYEHEGYVSDPTWYTSAMIHSSADLSIDVTQSGYGINPLRTYFGPSSSGINVQGSCTRIKGHQHFPNQNHTDPGIHWDWEEYYQLINNNPPVTTYSSNSGTLFDSGGPTGNYGDDEREIYLIEPPGAANVSIDFVSFDLEANWDYLFIYDGNSTSAPLIGQYTGSSSPGVITSSGGSLLIEFRSDCANNNSGWEMTWQSNNVGVVGDTISPVSNVSVPSNWVTTDFIANFSDVDNVNGSGIKHQFYQVIHYDGSDWRANTNEGFFSDNFDLSLHPNWTSAVGTWNTAFGGVFQSDESENNTNLYAHLNQDDKDKFLYHWTGRISGNGSNKRAGFHFMCSDGSLPNRGDSYFVWFRSDNNKVQIYKVVNDIFSLKTDVPFTIDDAQWYDFKVVYNKLSGKIDVWVDNALTASWIDSAPYTSGAYISLRSGHAQYAVDKLKVYTNRGNSEIVTIGPGNDLPYQNTQALSPSGRVKSIAIDTADNVSSISFQAINIDWTIPDSILHVHDGLTVDIDTFYNNTEISANWSTSSDTHSDVSRYWYAIGTNPGATNVVNWTDNWSLDTLVHSGLSLSYGSTYYVSVRPENGAGLLGATSISDGQYLDQPNLPPTANFTIMNTYVCAGDSIPILNSSSNASTYLWTIPGASISSTSDPNPMVLFPSTGTYTVTLDAFGPGGNNSSTQSINVTVEQQPIASFLVSDTLVPLSNGFVGFTNNSSNANGYFWDFGDGTQSSDMSPWHIYTYADTFQVMLIAINGTCPNDTIYQTIVVDANVGISEVELVDVQLFPNPASDQTQIFVQSQKSTQLSIDLHDGSGKLVSNVLEETQITGKRSIHIPVAGLAPGTYFILLKTKNHTKTYPLNIH